MWVRRLHQVTTASAGGKAVLQPLPRREDRWGRIPATETLRFLTGQSKSVDDLGNRHESTSSHERFLLECGTEGPLQSKQVKTNGGYVWYREQDGTKTRCALAARPGDAGRSARGRWPLGQGALAARPGGAGRSARGRWPLGQGTLAARPGGAGRSARGRWPL
eukprot:gene13640-biopygen21586